MNTIEQLMQAAPGLSLTVRAEDLRAFIRDVVEETVARALRSVAGAAAPADSEGLMSMQECADYLGSSYSVLRKMAADGEVPFVMLGKKRMFSRKALGEWMERNRVKSNDEIDSEAATYCATHRDWLQPASVRRAR